MKKYTATFYVGTQYNNIDFDTADEAAKAVEAVGKGSVTLFHLSKNIPFCQPEYVARSCALWTLEEGKWTARSIFGGTCTSLHEERPY